MSTPRCPHCHQLLPEFRFGVRLADLKARILDMVRRAGQDGIAGDDLFAVVYDEQRVRWKRDRASRKALKAHVYGINEAIKTVGFRIVCSGRNGNSTYRLQRSGGER
jgi:hypothetical protein